MSDVAEPQDLPLACRAFIAAAFDVLCNDHVIPTPVFHPFVAVGRDYVGPHIMGLAAYKALKAQLEETYPERLAEPLKRRHAEFASTYMFSLLEACVARCGRDQTFDVDAPAVDESVTELLTLLELLKTTTDEIICARHVST